jgi:hypothetical protein
VPPGRRCPVEQGEQLEQGEERQADERPADGDPELGPRRLGRGADLGDAAEDEEGDALDRDAFSQRDQAWPSSCSRIEAKKRTPVNAARPSRNPGVSPGYSAGK